MITLKVHKHAVDLYFNTDEQYPRQPNEGHTRMDTYIGARVGFAMFCRSNGSIDMGAWRKWKHSLNL